MKKCQQCGFESENSMRFCLDCGATLPDAPIIVNLQGGGAAREKQSNVNTASYGKSAETVVGGTPYRTNFSAPPPKTGGGKIFVILGGVLALFLLFSIAAGAIAYFILVPKPKPEPEPFVDKITPKPTADRTPVGKSPTPSPTLTPITTPTPFPSLTPSPKTATVTKNKVERMWVDYNVKENNRTGMKIHVKFWVYDLKGVDTYLAVYFQKKDGTRLLTQNTEYGSKDGQVAVFKLLKPAYDPAVYEDTQFFIPYDELNLSRGKHDLQMDVDLIYKDGGMIQHLHLHDFWFEQR